MKPPRLRAWAASLCCIVGLAAPAAAHPHIWIEYSAAILSHGNALTGVRMTWTFDEMYSASLFRDYTSRPTGKLSPADIAQLNKEAFQNSREQHYFTELVVDGKTQPVTETADFDAAYDGRKMTYRFTVPLRLRLDRDAHTLDIVSFDTEFYIDFELALKDAVTIQGIAPSGLSCEPSSMSRHTTMFGSLMTRIVHCAYEGSSLGE